MNSASDHDFWASIQEDFDRTNAHIASDPNAEDSDSRSPAKRLKIWTPENELLCSTVASPYASSFTSLASNSTPRQECDFNVCFGTICNAPIQPRGPVRQPEVSPDNSKYFQFNVIVQGKTLSLQNFIGEEFAVLGTALTRKLEDLLKIAGVWCLGFVPVSAWLQHAHGEALSSSSLTIEINIFGPFSQSNTIATLLSTAGLFLQQPQVFQLSMVYHNPHFLSVEPSTGSDILLTPIFCIEEPYAKRKHMDEPEVEIDIHMILDTMPHQDFLLQQMPSSG